MSENVSWNGAYEPGSRDPGVSRPSAGTRAESADPFTDRWIAFRRAWLAYLGTPYGLLSPVGLHWLDESWRTFTATPGEWRTVPPGGIAVRAGDGEDVVVDGAPLRGELVIPDAATECPSIMQGDTLMSPVVFPAQAGQPTCFGIQTRSPHATAERLLLGIPTFPPSPRWVLPARFEPYAEDRPVTLNSIVNQMVKDMAIFGRVVFTYGGREYALEVYAGPPDELHVPFRDRTSGISTFAGSRLVFVPRPASAGRGAFEFEIDFNHAVNGPCGLSQCTTCALPPPGNTLPFAVEAGEKIPMWMPQPGDWAR